MTSSMDPLDRPLDRELRSLPDVHASTGFTAAVLRRLDRAPLRRPRAAGPLGWTALAAGAAGLVAVAVLILAPMRERSSSARLASEASDIRRQHEMLTLELNRLRARTEGTAPVLYLGGVDEIDYVLDLSPFLLPQNGAVAPASTRKNTTFQVTRELQ